jgi:hypothetical protein
MDLDIRIFFFYHKPQLVIKIFLTLKIGCSVHEFILLLNLLDICASIQGAFLPSLLDTTIIYQKFLSQQWFRENGGSG